MELFVKPVSLSGTWTSLQQHCALGHSGQLAENRFDQWRTRWAFDLSFPRNLMFDCIECCRVLGLVFPMTRFLAGGLANGREPMATRE